MKAHVLYLCALSSAIIYSADARSFLYPNSWGDTLPPSNEQQSFEAESQVSLFLESPALKNSYKTAGVYFITNNKGQVFSKPDEGSTFDDPSGKQCIGEGYSLTSCDGTASDYCPYNDKYFKTCCDASYKYSKSLSSSGTSSSSSGSGTSLSTRFGGTAAGPSISGNLGGLEIGQAEINPCFYPQTLSEQSCGGKYRCECKASSFPFSVCDEPQIKGETCSDGRGVRYASCTCPTSVETPYDCKTYYGAPCGDICKEAYEDTCHRYEGKGVKAPYGCKEPFDENCQSICKVAYENNCHNYEDALDSCPGGATCTYYDDCKSKVKSFTCKTGLVKSGNACLFPLPVVYGDKTVTKEFLADKAVVGIVFDEENKLAVSLYNISSFTTEWWATQGVSDIPDLENCEEKDNVFSCGVDGRSNMDKILFWTKFYGNTAKASSYANSHQPRDCSDDFCKAGEWFLPSMRDLKNIYQQKALIESILVSLGHDKFNNYNYWSSTEKDRSFVWSLDMRNGSSSSDYKDGTYGRKFYTRAVVSFGERKQQYIPKVPLPILYGDGTVSTIVTLDKKPIGIVFDETNKLAVALTNVNEDGKAAGSSPMCWSKKRYNIPDLESCAKDDLMSCAVDGRTNTDKILACGDNCEETPAATGCNLYQPTDCTEDFCKQGKWFLPSMRDLNNISQQKTPINTILTYFKKDNFPTQDGRYYGTTQYWSSNMISKDYLWSFDMRSDSNETSENECMYHHYQLLARPVIKYPKISSPSLSQSGELIDKELIEGEMIRP